MFESWKKEQAEIKDFSKELGPSWSNITTPEIGFLKNTLFNNEQVINIIRCSIQNFDDRSKGILALTNMRVIAMKKGKGINLEELFLPLNRIQSVQSKDGTGSKIVINSIGCQFIATNVVAGSNMAQQIIARIL